MYPAQVEINNAPEFSITILYVKGVSRYIYWTSCRQILLSNPCLLSCLLSCTFVNKTMGIPASNVEVRWLACLSDLKGDP